ncbi:MAG: cold-shock protein [Sphingomonas bacterium]|uniref:cold-shock protein n=1 Tax=Sphingomonas bacterium TaxID=1895847 RepID=UPI002608ADE1|nr:cold-shock protein [Sphingomonas bacterium]MDB5706240.1 cold-shock protein [Sphingomonas bacterium]
MGYRSAGPAADSGVAVTRRPIPGQTIALALIAAWAPFVSGCAATIDPGRPSSSGQLAASGIGQAAMAPDAAQAAPPSAPDRQWLVGAENLTGTVLFFNTAKGFGFIRRDDGGNDLFVNTAAVKDAGLPTLSAGDRLLFSMEVDRRGKPSAGHLRMQPR